FVVGSTQSNSTTDGFPVTLKNAAQTNLAGTSNAFVLVVHGGGQSVDYSSYYGGAGYKVNGETGVAIAVDSLGQAFITGSTFSSNLTTTNAYQTKYQGDVPSAVCGNNGTTANQTSNAFLAEFDPTQVGA